MYVYISTYACRHIHACNFMYVYIYTYACTRIHACNFYIYITSVLQFVTCTCRDAHSLVRVACVLQCVLYCIVYIALRIP